MEFNCIKFNQDNDVVVDDDDDDKEVRKIAGKNQMLNGCLNY